MGQSVALDIHPKSKFDKKTNYHADNGLAVSEGAYWEKYYEYADIHYEWNNGILEEKPVSDRLTYLIYDWFCRLLDHYLASYPIAEKSALETGFRLALPNKTVIRKPDMAVFLKDNPIPFKSTDRSYQGIFDLCIEALSNSTPKEKERDTVTKKEEYQTSGVKEYYILDGWKRETAFYYLDKQGIYQAIEANQAGVICSTILPGFQFRISDLYEKPDFESLMDDEIYRDFVLPKLRAERELAKQEKARADRLTAKLKALGIDPD